MSEAEAPLILVVDDDAGVCWAVERVLAGGGYRVQIAADAAAARRQLKRMTPDAIITDVRMPGESGLDLLAWLRREMPNVPVIVTTAHGAVDVAMEAVRRGACDYLAKPLDGEPLLIACARALGDRPLAAAARPLAATRAALVGGSTVMQLLYRRIAAAAGSDLDVLITGPSGSGKSLAAHTIVRFAGIAPAGTDSPIDREATERSAPDSAAADAAANSHVLTGTVGAVEIACSRIDAAGFDAALTAALRAGNAGIVILEGVDELLMPLQARLAGLLEHRRWGDLAWSGRVVATANAAVEVLAHDGRMRPELLWRLRAFAIAMPALREHLDDVPELVRALLGRMAARSGRSLAITDPAMNRLHRHEWPGNVRELAQILGEAAALSPDGVIDRVHIGLPGDGADQSGLLIHELLAAADRMCAQHPGEAHARFIDLVESPILQAALARTRGNQLRAAEMLGINRSTVKKRMDQLGLGLGRDGSEADT